MPDDKMLSQEEIDALLNQPTTDSNDKNEGNLNQGNLDEEAMQDPTTSVPSSDYQNIEVESMTQEAKNITHSDYMRITEKIIQEPEVDLLSPEEKDALGEIGNISMGTASTTLSELLQQRVSITSPKVRITTQKQLFNAFQVPYIVIQVQFKDGLDGFNILVIRLRDAMVMANLMMGGDGTQVSEEISDMEISAASEAMNQMIGTASTSLAALFSRNINISPPVTNILNTQDQENINLPIEDPLVIVSFKLIVGELLDTEIMQILDLKTARTEASLLWQGLGGFETTSWTGSEQPIEETSDHIENTPNEEAPNEETPGASHYTPGGIYDLDINQERLAMLMDIPLKATVILGRSKKPIKEILSYTPGAIVELSSEINEPVEILVNGVLVAKGEIVVVNENFGVKVTEILTPAERIERLIE